VCRKQKFRVKGVATLKRLRNTGLEDTEVLDMEEMEDMADMEYMDISDNNLTSECYFTRWLMITQL
jgi:hypothetical protein